MKYLLRISPKSQYETCKSLFALMEQVASLDIPMCLPVEFGFCKDGVYSIQSWINGADLGDVLQKLSDSEQYSLGFQAGEILNKIHNMPVSDTLVDFWTAEPVTKNWETRFSGELYKEISEYQKGELHFDGDAYVLDYIERARPLLKDRPQCVGFDDYNVMNMMYSNGSVVIIDFERYNICDPWEEFSDIVWSVRYSHHFATGQIQGYFGGEPPEKFWGLFALYMSNYLLSFWKNQPISNDIWYDATLGLSKNVLHWFDNMKNPVPTWYV
jgi:aminoglycoside phosphotransferase (APT) family kinase protein